MKATNKIQRVELNGYEQALHCPFCGQRVMQPDPEALDLGCHPCDHTLFIATDEGFEHRSERFDTLMGIAGVAADALELGGKGYDGFTDGAGCPDAVKFAVYVPAPSGLGAYYGFAP